VILVSCQGAFSQNSECSKVAKASERLACYDRIAPPTAAKPLSSKQKAAATKDAPDQGAVVDALAVENEKLGAKLKKICRGC
jgi:type II secretory pathway component PulL